MSDLIIVGGGYSGYLSAIQALEDMEYAYDNVRSIALIEKVPAQLAGGVAFSEVTAKSFLETNTAIKNTAIDGGNRGALAAFYGLDANEVMPRRLMQSFLRKELKRSERLAGIQVEKITDETATDVMESPHGVRVGLASGKLLTGHAVILATGNLQQRELPCVTHELKKNNFFNSRYVANQWLPEEQEKITAIPRNANVLVVGTALSGYDTVRTLRHQKHQGDIWMVSRHGLEHFRYPKKHDWKDVNLPRPKFLNHLLYGSLDQAKAEAAQEFRWLTGLKIDLDAQTIRPTLRKAFHAGRFYTPEQVLRQWEKHVTKIVNYYGQERFGRFLKDYSAMINVLRVGAGHDVCEEIDGARETGQLTVRALDIEKITPLRTEDGLSVKFKGVANPVIFHTVISSLGPDHDYNHVSDPLWRNVIERGYTDPHPVGIGVKASVRESNYGRLARARHIYGAGICVAGNNIVGKGVIGPPAFSVNGMRDGIRKTASVAVTDVSHQLALERAQNFTPPPGW